MLKSDYCCFSPTRFQSSPHCLVPFPRFFFFLLLPPPLAFITASFTAALFADVCRASSMLVVSGLTFVRVTLVPLRLMPFSGIGWPFVTLLICMLASPDKDDAQSIGCAVSRLRNSAKLDGITPLACFMFDVLQSAVVVVVVILPVDDDDDDRSPLTI